MAGAGEFAAKRVQGDPEMRIGVFVAAQRRAHVDTKTETREHQLAQSARQA